MNVKLADVFFLDMMESFLTETFQDAVGIISSKSTDEEYNVIVSIRHEHKKTRYFLLPNLDNSYAYYYVNIEGSFIPSSREVNFTLEQLREKFKSLTGLKLNMTLHLSTDANKKMKRNHSKKNKYWGK